MAYAWERRRRGDPSAEVSQLADRALALRSSDRPSINGYLGTAAAVLFATVDDFDRAHRICDKCSKAARDRGILLAERSIELARAVALLHQGRLVEACDLARDLLGHDQESQRFHTAEAAAILASGLHEQGVHHETEQIIRAALASSPADEPRGLLLLEVSARVALEHGDLVGALRIVGEAASLANALGVANPGVVAWQPTAAQRYKAVGQPRRAHALAQEALEVAESFGMPRAIALALRTKAGIEGGAAELDHLKAALEVIDDPMPSWNAPRCCCPTATHCIAPVGPRTPAVHSERGSGSPSGSGPRASRAAGWRRSERRAGAPGARGWPGPRR